jgi:hypothetical protein
MEHEETWRNCHNTGMNDIGYVMRSAIASALISDEYEGLADQWMHGHGRMARRLHSMQRAHLGSVRGEMRGTLGGVLLVHKLLRLRLRRC